MENSAGIIRRNITDHLLQALADTPVVLVNGARQTGKSTLVQSTELAEPGRQYLTFDDPSILAAAKRDPSGFVSGLNTPVILDEVQHVPEVFPVIKLALDRRREPGRFLLTGSANVLLLPKLSESLAGRMEVLTLWPFSQGEINGVQEGFIDTLFSKQPDWQAGKSSAPRRAELFAKILAGGYPPLATRRQAARRKAWFQSYLMTILQRDIRDLANISDLTAVPQLLSVIASRAGALLNFADLSRSLSLPQTTLKRYFALLETTFLVQLLRSWSVNTGQRAILTPKVYLNDTGLLAHLVGLTLERLELDPGMAGGVLENFVLMELRKQSAWSETQPEFFYWRTASGQEVDIVLEDSAGRIVGIEVKASATLHGGDLRGLETLAKATHKRWLRGVVLYTGSEIVPFTSTLHGVPVSLLWQTPHSRGFGTATSGQAKAGGPWPI
ncbi:MAG TPA: ATP-binding protein [Candidatus Limnocylindrales bacterium]|jgi:predicted AAA+ superfamily ATPase|nr:ATP-binding protein [Candidatus Limnocylindrales bacterium]